MSAMLDTNLFGFIDSRQTVEEASIFIEFLQTIEKFV